MCACYTLTGNIANWISETKELLGLILYVFMYVCICDIHKLYSIVEIIWYIKTS